MIVSVARFMLMNGDLVIVRVIVIVAVSIQLIVRVMVSSNGL